MPTIKTGGKHKRGDRGSTEEEANTSKRANMASVLNNTRDNPTFEDDENLDTTDEPTLAELKEMLVDIQISIQSILRENKETRRELAELKETVLEQRTTIASLKTTLVGLEKQCAKNEKDLDNARKTIDEQIEEIAELYDLQDQLEQYTRKNSLEIHGVPESAYSSTEEAVLKLAEALEVPVRSQDIEISHKLPNKGTKAIIVKFVSHKMKSQLYKERVNLKNVRVSDLFPSATSATRAEATRIFLNENLTSYRRKIVKRANEMKRDGLLLSVWTLDGKIFVKTSPSGTPIRIMELEDLEAI